LYCVLNLESPLREVPLYTKVIAKVNPQETFKLLDGGLSSMDSKI